MLDVQGIKRAIGENREVIYAGTMGWKMFGILVSSVVVVKSFVSSIRS